MTRLVVITDTTQAEVIQTPSGAFSVKNAAGVRIGNEMYFTLEKAAEAALRAVLAAEPWGGSQEAASPAPRYRADILCSGFERETGEVSISDLCAERERLRRALENMHLTNVYGATAEQRAELDANIAVAQKAMQDVLRKIYEYASGNYVQRSEPTPQDYEHATVDYPDGAMLPVSHPDGTVRPYVAGEVEEER